MPSTLNDATLRQTIRASVGGERFRFVLSNEYGRIPLQVGQLTVRSETGAAVVRFQGAADPSVPPGSRWLSDPVDLHVQAGERLEVDLYLPHESSVAGFHWEARETTLLFPGRIDGRKRLPPAQKLSARAYLVELQVETRTAPNAVVTLGDSLTDGNASSVGEDQRWPDHLARRLAQRGVPVLNAGISGNRLLRDGMGESALARFERDVLARPGVRAVVVLLGTNDIGWPGGPFAPGEPPAIVAHIAQAFEQLAARARARGIRVIVATLPPFENALQGTPLEGHYSPTKELLRQSLNAWIRASAAFDGVIDFDAVLRDPSRPSRLLPGFDSGDHLHPSDAGYRAMAEAVDLGSLLGGAVDDLSTQGVHPWNSDWQGASHW